MHGFDPNSAAGEKVADHIKELDMERKEKPEQLAPIRLAELRGATDVAMFGMQLDGLLRGNECASDKWKHINRMPGLKVHESAVAKLHRMIAEGRHTPYDEAL